jgi:hypothetical protein
MPMPIKTVQELESHKELFDCENSFSGISELQSIFLNEKPIVKAASTADDYDMSMLEKINENEDSLINAASEFATERKAKSLYSVPREIGDNDLLRLKTRGYVIGSGRSVSITDKGKEVLKSKWLRESNTFKQNRETEKFDYRKHSIARISATDNKKFRRVEG